MDNILKMLRMSNAPTVSAGEDEIAQDVDEPPDDKVPELHVGFKKEVTTKRPSVQSLTRRESLLTRAIQAGSEPQPTSPQFHEVVRGMSTTSSHSFASTAELTSDVESLVRSASPSPPPPLNRIHFAPAKIVDTSKILVAETASEGKPAEVVSGEAAIEKSLGRKRCIMFACGDSTPDTPSTADIEPKALPKIVEEIRPELPLRKTRISFACPTRPMADSNDSLTANEPPRRRSSPCPAIRKPLPVDTHPRRATDADSAAPIHKAVAIIRSKPASPPPQTHPFHEFASSHDETDAWVEKASEAFEAKLTVDDCYMKEQVIRKIGQEAEEEAEAEERELEEIENEIEEDDGEDDFAPSDDDHADDGNESDDEEGFAESDSESDGGSDYQFWAPSTTTAATSTDNLTHFSSRQSRSRNSSTSSAHSYVIGVSQARRASKVKIPKSHKMRPGTPELPDSTDFVCGTFDEDRPLEAAYISCREQKRREKQVLIPQDIDPSFPTTDPEDEVDEDEDVVADSAEPLWLKDQFEGFDDESERGRRPSAFLISPLHSPSPALAPLRPTRPSLLHRRTPRSPAPQQHLARSPAPRRLFDHSSRRLRSPAPTGRLRSPRGSPADAKPTPFGITINHLAQRPNADKTSSLPHTPNPFFRNWRNGSQPVSRITSAAVTPGIEEPHPDMHVRGPVDIVIGLEKKRQKRKEKYWRLNCRKAAKEHADKKPARGKGVERMKELGLECAERTKGYNLGQQAHLVLSL